MEVELHQRRERDRVRETCNGTQEGLKSLNEDKSEESGAKCKYCT